MPFDLDALSPEERDTYLRLGRRFDPADALKQADLTLGALPGLLREVYAQGFLLEDWTTLGVARDRLKEILEGAGAGPVDPDAVPVLAGLVVTLAREAEKAAQEAAKAAYGKSNNMADLLPAYTLRMVAKPIEPEATREVSSLQELFAHAAEQDRQAQALRELRRARARSGGGAAPTEEVEDRTAAPYRAVPKGRKALPKKGNSPAKAPKPGRILWEMDRDACQKEVREHGRSALKSAGFLALGAVALVVAAEQDKDQHTQANSKLGAAGAILIVVSLVGLIRGLSRYLMASLRLRGIRRREP